MSTGIYYNRPYAFFLEDAGKYLRYGRQGEGAVNLIWSDEPGYEWVFRKQDLDYLEQDQFVEWNDQVAVLNIVATLEEGGWPNPACYLVYSKRLRGVTLIWGRFGPPHERYHDACEWCVSSTSSDSGFSLYNTSASNPNTEKFLCYDEGQTEGIELGWAAIQPDCLQVSSSPCNMILKTIVCQVTASDFSQDDVSFFINLQKVWGPHGMDNGHTYHLQEVQPIPVFEGDLAFIQIREDYYGNIAQGWAYIAPGDYPVVFGKLWDLGTYNAYMLFYSVEKAGQQWPKKLIVVRPSLGHPLILKPEDLCSFIVKVATRSLGGSLTKAIENMQTSIVLEDAQTGETWQCLAEMAEGSSYTEIQERRKLYRNLRDHLNDEQSRFPRINDEFRAGCWMVSDFDVRVTPQNIGGLVNALTAEQGKPRMFNLHLGESTAYHSIFVSTTLPDAQDIGFLHVTDTHITQRNDIVPIVIDSQLDHEYQREDLRRVYRNPNDHLRGIIRYANEKFEKGEIDFVVITGDIIDYIHERDWGDWGASQPNFHKLREIITGLDSLGESLLCPLFVIPGNHEFYPLEIPLRWWQRTPVVDDVERSDGLNSAGLKGDEEYEGDPFGYYSKLLSNAGKGFGLVSETSGYRLLVQVYPTFVDYLTEISYDPSFAVNLGQHQLVFLNTGEDAGRPSKAELADAAIVDSYYGGWPSPEDFHQHGLHCAGFSTEDIAIATSVLSDSQKDGLVFIFAHAPLINLESNPGAEDNLGEVFEYDHENSAPPPNEVTEFLYWLEPWYHGQPVQLNVPSDDEKKEALESAGYPQWGTRYFKSGPRDRLTDFGCAGLESDGRGLEGGYADELLNLLLGKEPGAVHKCAVFFSGHTHHILEYRVDEEENARCFYADNYSGTKSDNLAEASDKFPEMPLGEKDDHLPAHQHETAAWLSAHAPLLLISGALKSKERPQFREIHARWTEEGPGIDSMQMKQIERWQALRSPRGLEYLWIAESIAMELLTAAAKETEPDLGGIKDSIDPCEYATRVISIGPNLALRALINRSSLIYRHWWFRHLDNLSQSAQNELDRLLLELAGYFVAGPDKPCPEWYEQHRHPYGGHAAALFYAVTSVRLNRFGVDFSYPVYNSLDLQGHYEWALYADTGAMQLETKNRMKRLSEFARRGSNRLLCMWYASESTYLAELGGYKVAERNTKNPSYHLDWSLSLPPEVVVLDLIVKYELQAEHQLNTFGIDALKWLYGVTAARLASWGGNCSAGRSSDSINHDYYLQQCADWDDQRILDSLSSRVHQVGQKLIEEA